MLQIFLAYAEHLNTNSCKKPHDHETISKCMSFRALRECSDLCSEFWDTEGKESPLLFFKFKRMSS